MALFISVLLTMGTAVWFYKTAERLQVNPVQWGIAGAVAYQIPAWAWMIIVSKPYVSSLQGSYAKTTLSANFIAHSWILIGIIAALLIYKFVLLKTSARASG
jgi:hypothetical protein